MLINQGLFSEQFSSGSSFKVGRFFSPVTEPVFNGVADLGCDYVRKRSGEEGWVAVLLGM